MKHRQLLSQIRKFLSFSLPTTHATDTNKLKYYSYILHEKLSIEYYSEIPTLMLVPMKFGGWKKWLQAYLLLVRGAIIIPDYLTGLLLPKTLN